MKDFQDIELFVELTPEELEELQGGYGVLGPLDFFPNGIPAPAVLSKKSQGVASPVISNSINRGPEPDPWVSLQSLSVNQQGF